MVIAAHISEIYVRRVSTVPVFGQKKSLQFSDTLKTKPMPETTKLVPTVFSTSQITKDDLNL